MSRNVSTREKKRLARAPPVTDYQQLIENYTSKGYELMQAAMEGTLSVTPSEQQFQLFCVAITQSQARIANSAAIAAVAAASAAQMKPSSLLTGTQPPTAAAAVPAPVVTPAEAPTKRNSVTASSPHALIKQLSVPVLPNAPTETKKTEQEVDTTPTPVAYNPVLQEKLQTAIDATDMQAVLVAVSEGAVIESKHVKQVAAHIGDQYLPMFALLLTGSTSFMAERIARKDSNTVLNAIQNPINAFLCGSQIDRWNHCELTRREVSGLTENKSLQDTISGPHETTNLWRNVVLKLIDIRAQNLAMVCKVLPEHRTVDEEVVEVMKRQKIERLNAVHASLSAMFGLTLLESDCRVTVPALVVTQAVVHTGVTRKSQLHIEEHKDRDIYTVLREFTLMTGTCCVCCCLYE